MESEQLRTETPREYRKRIFADLMDNFRLVNELPHLVLVDIVSAEVEARSRESNP